VKLVIFDCDGVLIDSEPIACAIMAEVFTANGFPLTATDIHAFIGQDGATTYAEVERRFGKKLPADIRDRNRAIYRTRLATDPMPAISGVADLIDSLSTASCVASNSSHEYLAMVLASAQLGDKFPQRIFSSYDVARPKPYPDLFEYAARTLGVAPEGCIVIEDSVHGVNAGVAAGMRVIGFCGGGHCLDGHANKLMAAGAHIVCASMDEVAHHLGADGYLK